MDNPRQLRLDKLRAEVAKFDTVAAFARQYDLDETYIRQLLSGHRSFGERSASTMSVKICGHPNLFDPVATPAPTGEVTATSLLAAIDKLDTVERAMFFAGLKAKYETPTIPPKEQRTGTHHS